jgi:DNA-binding response OmpR family regulator
MRVLLAEDDAQLAETMARGLRRQGMAVDVAGDGAVALEKARMVGYDVLVLDRDLPELHGDYVCHKLLDERPDLKILMVTAARETDDVVHGCGSAPTTTCPSPSRSPSWWRACRRWRAGAATPGPPVLRHGDLELDPARRSATRDGRVLDLSPKELGVLEVLMEAGGAAVPVQTLLERVWDENIDPWTNTLRMTVMTLRRKLGDPPVVETVKGVGYRL